LDFPAARNAFFEVTAPDVRVVIISRGRSDSIGRNALALFPYATVTVDEREVDTYARVVPDEQLLPHPQFAQLSQIENWLHDQDLAEFVYWSADDVHALRCLVGWRARTYRDPELIRGLLEVTAVCARDAGAYLFGFGHHMVPTYLNNDRPFALNAYVREIYGFRRGHELRADPNVEQHYDVDVALQALLKHRIIWRDDRFVFDSQLLGSAKGGEAGVRTPEAVEHAARAMVQKWGKWVTVDAPTKRFAGGGTLNWGKAKATVINVQRRYS